MAIRIEYGVPTDRTGLDILFGIERGFFAEEGIDLSVQVVFGGPEISAAYDTGALKIGQLGSPPAITGIAHGKRFRIIGSGLNRRAGLHFIVHPSISAWPDLKGKTIGALSIGSCSYWYLRDLLAQKGLDPERDVHIRGLGADYAGQLELFARGEISALLTTEPNAAIGEARGVINYWGDVLALGDLAELQWLVHVANEEFLEHQPELVRAVMRTARRAARYLLDHRDEWIEFTARHYQTASDVAARSIERDLPFLHFDGQLDVCGLKNAIALQYKLGAIHERLPVSHFVVSGFQPSPEPPDRTRPPGTRPPLRRRSKWVAARARPS